MSPPLHACFKHVAGCLHHLLLTIPLAHLIFCLAISNRTEVHPLNDSIFDALIKRLLSFSIGFDCLLVNGLWSYFSVTGGVLLLWFFYDLQISGVTKGYLVAMSMHFRKHNKRCFAASNMIYIYIYAVGLNLDISYLMMISQGLWAMSRGNIVDVLKIVLVGMNVLLWHALKQWSSQTLLYRSAKYWN